MRRPRRTRAVIIFGGRGTGGRRAARWVGAVLLAARRAAGAAVLAVILAAGMLAAAGGAQPALAATTDPSCAAGTCTVSFTTPGTGQSFTVPAGVSSLAVTLYGGAGAPDDTAIPPAATAPR